MPSKRKSNLSDTSVWSYLSFGNQTVWTMTSTAQRTLADNATTQALNIIESRINALGVTEPTLQTHGAQSSHQILLQMPGVQDPERSRNSKGRIATRTGSRDWPAKSGAVRNLCDQRAKRLLHLTVEDRFLPIAESCHTENESNERPATTQRSERSKSLSSGWWLKSPAIIDGS